MILKDRMRLHKCLIKLSQMGSIFIEMFDPKVLNLSNISSHLRTYKKPRVYDSRFTLFVIFKYLNIAVLL